MHVSASPATQIYSLFESKQAPAEHTLVGATYTIGTHLSDTGLAI